VSVWNASTLLACLQWRDEARLGKEVRQQLLTRAAVTVRATDLYTTPQARDELLARLRALPPASLQSLLGAPELLRRLVRAHQGMPGFEAWFRECLAVEEARADAATPPAWSALGDLGPAPDGARVQAPLLDGVPVDFRSVRLDNTMDGGDYRAIRFGPSERYAACELGPTFEKLARAATLIRQARPSIWEFVRQSVRVIQLRRDDHNPDFYTSASCNAEIGRMVLLNPHLDDFDVPSLANALVHESIHATLYGLEQTAPLLPTVDPHDSDHLIVVSPWTGSRLHLHTYLHACLVWTGLAFLWRSLDRALAPEERRHLDRALSGFQGGAALAPLHAHRALLGEGVFETIEVLSGLLRADGAPDIDWEPSPVAEGRHGLGFVGATRSDGAPVFGKLSTRSRTDPVIAREGAILGGLADVPGVPRVLASTGWEGRPLLVLERLEARDLAASLERLLRAARGLAASLAAVHARRIVHRDVRPDHLLWRGETPVLVDFSCALALDNAAPPGGTVGAWPFAPPDQILPERPIPGFHWDTYAACVSLFLLLVGRAPRCQEDPAGRLSARGLEVWRLARPAVIQTPLRDDPTLRAAFARARLGLDEAALLAEAPAPALPAEDLAAIVEGVTRRGGDEALGWALARVIQDGLAARSSERYPDGGALARALAAAAPLPLLP